jgi:hypothetical protein
MIRRFRYLAALWVAGNLVLALVTWACFQLGLNVATTGHRAAVALRQLRFIGLLLDRCRGARGGGLGGPADHRKRKRDGSIEVLSNCAQVKLSMARRCFRSAAAAAVTGHPMSETLNGLPTMSSKAASHGTGPEKSTRSCSAITANAMRPPLRRCEAAHELHRRENATVRRVASEGGI